MYINLFKVYFALVGFSVLICSFMINYLESLTPSLIINSFRYGKLSCGYYKSFLFRSVEIPKRWFRHFYVVAVIWSTVTLCFTLYTYAYTVPVSKWILYLLDSIGSSERKVKINATSTIVALILFNAQTWRRFYETFFISIFSDSKMNIAHYGVGIAHYIGATFALIAESPLFASESFEYRNVFTFSDVSWNVIIGIITFLWAWYHQLKVAIILADLRKDDKGNVVTYDRSLLFIFSLPILSPNRVDWFEFKLAQSLTNNTRCKCSVKFK